MAKPKKSKLDQYAATLADMEAQCKTLAEMVAWLKEEGVTVAPSTLSAFLSSQRQARLQTGLLAQIASGSRQIKEVEAQFAKNPAPELESLIKLHRVLIFKLSTEGNADPELLKLADQLTRTAMEYVSGKTKSAQKERELEQAERKLQMAEKKAAQADATDKVLTDADLSPEERAQRIKEIYGRA